VHVAFKAPISGIKLRVSAFMVLECIDKHFTLQAPSRGDPLAPVNTCAHDRIQGVTAHVDGSVHPRNILDVIKQPVPLLRISIGDTAGDEGH
jgi:hypothetical protein